jgi:starch-binding outer membrane protein, SusD/RagB family
MNAKYLLTAAFSLALLSSCSDFLDVQPEGNATTTQYFTNDDQAVDAIDALYAPIHQEGLFGREIFWEQGGACDVVWGRTRSYPTLATLQYNGDESPLRGTYSNLMTVISRANWVVEKLLEKQASTTLTSVETRSLGEAYFMRAFAHFYVAYRYGTDKQGVPFTRYEDYEGGYDNSIPKQQASVVDNYKYIIEDLDKAIEYLPKFEEYDADNRGRAHKAAAVAYKAKTYAYWATWDKTQWNNVITMVDELENTYGRGLADNFDDIFSSDFSNFWTKEYLFGIAGNGGDTPGGSEFPGVVLENQGWGYYNGWGQNKPSYDIYEEMKKDGEGNARLKRSILEYGQEFEFFGETRTFSSSSDIEAGFMINKYMDAFKYENADKNGYVSTNGDWPTSRLNMPLIRFADVLLLRAEAYLATGNASKAATDINRVRTRSGLTPLTGNATWTDLYHERRCELAFEFADHLYDLKRWYHSGDNEIKALASKELNAHPRVRHYEDRADANSAFTVGDYEDYKNKSTYQDYMIAFPYPSTEITKSGGALKQNEGY